MIPVIDISKWQGKVDFGVMASRGVQGVIIRAGNGKSGDSAIGTYMPAAKAVGLKVGVYWFCNPKVSDGATQGRLLAEAHNRWSCDIPPMLDVENYLNEPGPELLVIKGPAFAAWLRDMVDATEAQSRKPIVYTNRAYWDPWVGDTTFGGYDNVIARYPWYNPTAAAANTPPTDAARWGEWLLARTKSRPQVPTGWADWQAWQFSAGFNKQGPAYGCSSSDLDLNIVRPDVWERWVGTRPPPIEPEKPIERPPTIEPPATATEGDDMRVINNSEVRNDGGRDWDKGAIKFGYLFNPGSGRMEKVHLGEFEYRPFTKTNAQTGPGEYANEAGYLNGELDAIPDYRPVPGGSVGEMDVDIVITGRGSGKARPV